MKEGRTSTQQCPPPGIMYDYYPPAAPGYAQGAPERSETSRELSVPLNACCGWMEGVLRADDSQPTYQGCKLDEYISHSFTK